MTSGPPSPMTGMPAGPTRRALMLGTASAAGLMAMGFAGAAEAQPAAAALGEEQFFALCQAVTGHADISPITARRIFAAMRGANPGFTQQAASLLALAKPGQAPEALQQAADAAGLRPAMMQMVEAWYTGTVGHGSSATLVSYAEALMYRPCADGLTVPTYCSNGPLWWTGAPPAAGVSAPIAAPPPAPAPAPAPMPAETPKAQ